MFIKNIYNTIIGILLEIGFVLLILCFVFVLCNFSVWVTR